MNWNSGIQSLEYRDSIIEGSRCVAPNVVPMKADRPLVEKTRVLNGSAVSAGMSGTLLLRSSSGFSVRLGDSSTVVDLSTAVDVKSRHLANRRDTNGFSY